MPRALTDLAKHELKSRACFLIPKAAYMKIVGDVERVASTLPDYKSILIESSSEGVGEYNLLEGAVESTWFGYRCLRNTPGLFCGVDNALRVDALAEDLQVLPNVDVERVKRSYTPSNLARLFTDTHPTATGSLPDEIKRNPFQARDGESDKPILRGELPTSDPLRGITNSDNSSDCCSPSRKRLCPPRPDDSERSASSGFEDDLDEVAD